MRFGTVYIQMTGADIPGTITYANENSISLYEIQQVDLLTAKLRLPYSQYIPFKNIAKRRGNEIKILGISGISVLLRKILTRPVLFGMLLMLLALTVWLPKRILFVAVEGNDITPTEQILHQAEKSGICFGAERSRVRSERVKNQLLENIPTLQWAGVNTVGCTAVIQVREDPGSDSGESAGEFSSIVASIDGIVTSCTVLSGSAVCAVGDAVKKDQVLISGYQDLGLVIKLTQSRGEVFAQTERTLELVTPAVYTETEPDGEEVVRYGLIFGKKRINLSKGSGISYAGCDKIYTQFFLTLPGGFVLPAALLRERIFLRTDDSCGIEENSSESLMLQYADSYLLDHIVSGEILDKSYVSESSDTVSRITVRYECVEMIGRQRTEEYQFDYGKND